MGPLFEGTWPHEVEAVDGRIVITRKDGSQAVLTYSEASCPADVRGCPLLWQRPLAAGVRGRERARGP